MQVYSSIGLALDGVFAWVGVAPPPGLVADSGVARGKATSTFGVSSILLVRCEF